MAIIVDPYVDALMAGWTHVLKQERVSRGMTQADVAAILGCPRATVSHWELNKWRPDTGSWIPWSRVFGMEIALLESEEDA